MTAVFSDQTVAVPGGDLLVRRWNPARSALAPIILLHDSLGSIALWRDFPPALAEATQREVIAYDRLGFGRSSARQAPPGPRFIREEAERYFPALQEALGLSEYLLFGHSVGGVMALTIASMQPESCKLVISESAQPHIEARTLDSIEAVKATFADPAQFEKLAKWHGGKARWVLDAWTETWLSPEFRTWSLHEDLAKVRCPVLAIHGDGDEYGSVELPRTIVGNVRGPSQLGIIADCGHIPHRQKAEEVLQLSTTFIRQHQC